MEVDGIPSDIVIVGAGLVGSALACAVKAACPHMQISIVDAGPELARFSGDKFDPRVLALSDASCQLLKRLGVWEDITRERLCPYRAMTVWDSEGTGKIHFDAADSHQEQLGVIVESSVVLRALRQRLAGFADIHWYTNSEVVSWQSTDDGNYLETASGDGLSAALVVAADGAHSTVRRLANLATREWDYYHLAIITTIRCEQPHQNIARQWFSHNGPLAFLPLAEQTASTNSHYCSIVWSQRSAAAERLLAMNDADFCAALSLGSESELGRIVSVDQRFSVPLVQSHAKLYGRPGLALVGDAAHRLHPLAGQGANLGLYDVDALAQEIVRADQRHIPLHHASLVARYQRQRKLHNLAAMVSMEGFKRLFESEHPLALVLRNQGLNWVDYSAPIKKHLIKIAAGHLTG